jgi:uncharacterized protein (TIGR01244 family)
MKRVFPIAAVLLASVACSQVDGPPPAVRSADPAAPVANVLQLPDLRQPEAGIYTSGRLDASDVARLHAAGVRQVVDLSLDAETPDFDEAAAMREAGISYDALPIAGADALTRGNVEAFDSLLRDARGPVLVHCGSGNRVGAMAALRAAWIEGQPAESAIEEGKAWGLQSLEPKVRDLLEAPAR